MWYTSGAQFVVEDGAILVLGAGVSVVIDIFGVEVGSGVLVRTGGHMEGTGVTFSYMLTGVMCDCVLDAVLCEAGSTCEMEGCALGAVRSASSTGPGAGGDERGLWLVGAEAGAVVVVGDCGVGRRVSTVDVVYGRVRVREAAAGSETCGPGLFWEGGEGCTVCLTGSPGSSRCPVGSYDALSAA